MIVSHLQIIERKYDLKLILNFRNGTLAIGVLVGVLLVLIGGPISMFFGFPVHMWKNELFLGSALSGSISLLVALSIYYLNVRDRLIATINLSNAKILQNWIVLESAKQAISDARLFNDAPEGTVGLFRGFYICRVPQSKIWAMKPILLGEVEYIELVQLFSCEQVTKELSTMNRKLEGLTSALVETITEAQRAVEKFGFVGSPAHGGYMPPLAPEHSKQLAHVLENFDSLIVHLEGEIDSAKIELIDFMAELSEVAKQKIGISLSGIQLETTLDS